jgi:enoyl-CoA hydratase
MTDDDVLLIETGDRVRTLTLNRPKARNALSSALRTQFFAALRDAEAEDDVDVVILTGADPVFCAGLDLKELGDSTDLPDISPQWPAMTKPVIGAINGAAVTGGLEFALYCDILIASEQARFADTHARFALVAGWGMTQRLPRRVGSYKAREMMFTGREYTGREAEQMGLANACVPDEELDTALADLVASIVAGSWFSHREHKRTLLRTDGFSLTDGLADEAYRIGRRVGPDFDARVAGRFGRDANRD